MTDRISIDEFKALQKKSGRKRSEYRESQIQQELCNYCRLRYPDALFNVDLSGVNLSRTQAGIAKTLRSRRGYPDFVLYEARSIYHGLFIELKDEGFKLYKSLLPQLEPVNEHIAEQLRTRNLLMAKGYFVEFACGLSEAISLLDHYMSFPDLNKDEPIDFTDY